MRYYNEVLGSEEDLLTIGLVNEMFIESRNDEYSYPTLADQSAIDMF